MPESTTWTGKTHDEDYRKKKEKKTKQRPIEMTTENVDNTAYKKGRVNC